jgi:hypothetical protein
LKQQLVDALEMQSQLNITLESVTEQLRANETQRLAALQQVPLFSLFQHTLFISASILWFMQVTEATSELSRTQLLLEDAESSVDQLRDQLADTLNRHVCLSCFIIYFNFIYNWIFLFIQIVERNAFESQIAQLKSDFQISSDQANAEFNAKLHLHEQHARDSESALHSTISQVKNRFIFSGIVLTFFSMY